MRRQANPSGEQIAKHVLINNGSLHLCTNITRRRLNQEEEGGRRQDFYLC